MYKKNREYPLYQLPKIKNLCDMVIQKTETQPDGIAFAWIESDSLIRITYREFKEDVCKTIAKLHRAGIRNTNIGIMGRNSYRWLVLYMAVLCSGNTAVILDRDMGEEEFRDVCRRMDVRRVLIDTSCPGIEDFGKTETGEPAFIHYNDQYNKADPFFDQDWEDHAISGTELQPDLIDNNAVACIFLTSGTTGKRKGVMLSHANIAADINGSCQLFELEGDTLAVLPFHHAFGLIVAVWMVFHYGHTVYISQGLRRIRKELPLVKPQTMMLVPAFVESFYKMVMMSQSKGGAERSPDCAGRAFFGGMLEYVICGGASLDKQYIQRYRAFGIEILNGYGTTECSPVAAVNRNGYHKDGTVGIALPDTRVIVSDEGEILIAGSHVMKGYHNDPEGTAEVLRGGWYYTGDLGFLDEDGFITLTGRKNNIIILSSGENISPEELEGKLLRIKDIEEVVVSAGERGLTAEIYTKSGCDEASKSIRAEINAFNATIPMYRRINDVFFRKQPFRKTTSGKIIRRPYDAGKNQDDT